ncbi:MAG: hypothetical protein HQL44_05205 [Alphaproteobacteria bacterium]|nr:hypothetical protein [Alphaproteobacteria bacterium]
MKPLNSLFFLFVVAVLCAGSAGFAVGAITVHFNLPPYKALVSSVWLAELRTRIRPDTQSGPETGQSRENLTRGEGEVLAQAFTDDLVAPSDQMFSPVLSLDELHQRLEAMRIPDASLPRAYSDLSLSGADERSRPGVLIVSFDFFGKRQALAYKRHGPDKSRCALLVIPGSGYNQAWEMMRSKEPNYQKNIVSIGPAFCDTFVQIKPADSIAAIHDGQRSLNFRSIAYYLINRGASYSTLYLTEALALAKHLRKSYPKLVIAGLSQGGQAAAILSTLSNPDGAIIASGYSVLNDKYEIAGMDQLAASGLYELYSQEAIKAWLAKGKTQSLFTWGSQEGGVYGMDAMSQLTCESFKEFKNVQCRVHPAGHVYWQPYVTDFLSVVLEMK